MGKILKYILSLMIYCSAYIVHIISALLCIPELVLVSYWAILAFHWKSLIAEKFLVSSSQPLNSKTYSSSQFDTCFDTITVPNLGGQENMDKRFPSHYHCI